MAAAGAGLVIVVTRDGSPLWQTARGLAALVVTAGACWLVGDKVRVDGAVVALAGGAIATGAGAGLAIPHLAKVGLGTTSVAGLLLVVGGVVLGMHGASTLVRRSPRLTRLVVVPGLLALSVLVMWCIGIAVAATNVPRTGLGERTPADADLSFDDVTFETADDVTLSGWYIPSENGAAVVLLHGAGSTRSGVLSHAVVLAREGYGVLLYDARGHGLSGGRAMAMGWYGDADIAGAVGFLERQPDVEDGRIAAVGMSMGGEQAVGAAAHDRRIKAVVGEGATGRTAADKAWLSEVHGWRGVIQEGIDHLVYGTMDLLTASAPPVPLREAVRDAAPRPVLLIAAGDVPDEADAGRFIQAGSPASVELWIVPDTGHTDALATHARAWRQRVLAFLARAIGPTG